MQEDAADIFIRARDDLVNAVSVLDEDISTHVEEYIFAKANLDANGFDLNPTWKEEVCDLLIKEKRKTQLVFIPMLILLIETIIPFIGLSLLLVYRCVFIY